MSIKSTKIIEGKFTTLIEAEEFLDRALEENGDDGLESYRVFFDDWDDTGLNVWTVVIDYRWNIA